jgi:hypothetical protein
MIAINVESAIAGAAVGFVAGAFTPSIGRIIKSFFVKETQKAEATVKTDVSAEAQVVAKKL